MALDGITVCSIVNELNNKIIGGRLDKVYQPNNDEIIISLRSGGTYKLLLSANSSHPRIHLTNIQRENPMTPPMFCMVLRKHISGGRITKIYQPDFERVVVIEFDAFNEMGDEVSKKLIVEIMGKHSNIILVDENEKILESIKHVSHDKSSVREVLPSRQYFPPPSQNKVDPIKNRLYVSGREITEKEKGLKIQQYIYFNYTGISPVSASEICHRAGLDSSTYLGELSESQKKSLDNAVDEFFNIIAKNDFKPEIIREPKTNAIVEFSPFEMTQFEGYNKQRFDSMSELLELFYHERDNAFHIAQRAHDIKRSVLSNIERCVKKRDIQQKTIKDTKDMDIWRLKGELITANIYAIEKGMNTFKTINFYDENNSDIEIALDPTKTPSENAQKYFNRYNKAKRTIAALENQIKQNDEELEYLENVLIAIENSTDAADLSEIRAELAEQGFIKKQKGLQKSKKQSSKKSVPYHFVSSDGYDIYVGKSNTQNDELTLKFAKSDDIWLHTKNIPGSHVIIKQKEGSNTPIPDATINEAANIAVYHSRAKGGSGVPVDYTPRKYVKKPNGSKPGFVIYEQNKTAYITVDESIINKLKETALK